jgi:hypothetical protein
MNPLLIGDFDHVEKNFIKKLRRKIIQQIIYIRKNNRLYDYKTIYNFSYFHLTFSLLFILLPFICLNYKLNSSVNDERNNFLNNYLNEKFFRKEKNISKFYNNNKLLLRKNFTVDEFKDFKLNLGDISGKV